MQAFDLIQAFAFLVGGEPPAGQPREPAAAGESFDAIVQGLLDTTSVTGAAHAVEDATPPEAAEPTPADPDLGAPLGPVDLSVLLSLAAPVPAAAPVPVVLAPPPDGADFAPEWVPTVPASDHLGEAPAAGTAPVRLPEWRAPSDRAGSAPDRMGAEAPRRPTAAAPHDVETRPAGGAPTPTAAEAPATDSITVGDTAGDRVTTPEPAGRQAEAHTPAGSEIPIVHGAPDRHLKIEPAPPRARGAVPRAAIPRDGAIVAPSGAAIIAGGGLEGLAPATAPGAARDTRPAEAAPTAQPALRDVARELVRLAAIPARVSTAEPSDATGTGTGGTGTGREGEPSGHGNARAPRPIGPHAAASSAADAVWTAPAPQPAAGDHAREPIERAQVPVASAPPVSAEIIAGPRPLFAPETVPLMTLTAPAQADTGPGAVGMDAVADTRARHMEALLAAGDPDRENLQTIVRAIRVTSPAAGVSEARLRLQPEHLGQVALNVRVEQGSVTAHFHAESPEAQRYIETHQHELRTALRQQGLEVKELVVSTDPNRRQQGRQDDSREQPRQRQRRAAPPAWDAPRFEVTV